MDQWEDVWVSRVEYDPWHPESNMVFCSQDRGFSEQPNLPLANNDAVEGDGEAKVDLPPTALIAARRRLIMKAL
jgi:hypothetical protein